MASEARAAEVVAGLQSPSQTRGRVQTARQRQRGARRSSDDQGVDGYHLRAASAVQSSSSTTSFLPTDQPAPLRGRKTLILDLDETLVHSSFRPVAQADYIIPVDIDGTVHNVYVIKRPFVEEFLERVGRLFEVVVFTASQAKYANPLLDLLDTHGVIHGRLFREHCTQCNSGLVKDLARLGRTLSQTIIIDNSPTSYLLQPENAIGCTSFIDNMSDRELLYIADFLETLVDVGVRRIDTLALWPLPSHTPTLHTRTQDVTKFLHLWNASAPADGEDLPQ